MDANPPSQGHARRALPPDLPWFRRLSSPILFLIISLTLVGGYLAFTIPVSVFPDTNFPRVVIGVDNGVMPIDQMLVTITRPLEEAVNSVPGLQKVWSITSRGSAEVDLFFAWNSDMILTLQRVDAVVARMQATLPPAAKVETHRMTFAVFPIIGYSLTSDTVPPNKLWEIATYDLKPRLNRLNGVATVIIQGGRVPEFQVTPDPARLQAAGITVPDILDAIKRARCGAHRDFALLDHPCVVPARLGNFAGCGLGHTDNSAHHLHRLENDESEFQFNDIGRPRSRRWFGHRRRDRGPRKYRLAPGRGANPF